MLWPYGAAKNLITPIILYMMKKFTITLSLLGFLLMAFNARAQDDKPEVKSYIGISGGLSFPLGEFKKADYNDNKAGFAKRGKCLADFGACAR